MARDPTFTSIETERLVLRRFEPGRRGGVRGLPRRSGRRTVPVVAGLHARARRRRSSPRWRRPIPVCRVTGSSSRSPDRATDAGWWATARWCSTPAIRPRPRSATPLDPGCARSRVRHRGRSARCSTTPSTGWARRAIRAVTDTRNAPSIAVAERLGMRRIATVRTTFKGAACDEHTYELRTGRSRVSGATCACARPHA